MSANVGTIDRIIRLLIGLGALAMAFFVGPYAAGGWGWEKIALVVVGVIMVGTSAIKFCPLYRILGLSTSSHE